ncbi:MAG: hypothetical protein N4A41_08650 [Crocinitomicaceae bacterium]|jgi:hypothetical protein|nr:hypothetical protein [Crocinitomicaceae bacterium]
MKDITKYMNILKVTLAVIGIGVCLFLFGGPNNTAELTEIETFRDGGKMTAATWYTIIVLVGCVALVLLFFVVQLITNTKKTLMSIVGILAAFVLYIILYSVGSSDTSESLGLTQSLGTEVASSTISATTAGLYVVFAGLGISVVAILAGSFLGKLIK